MAANPRVVTEPVTITWDGAPQYLPKGQIIDVPPGSALEEAIGAGRLEPVFVPGSTMIAPHPAAAAAPPVATAPKKTGSDGKETP